MSSLKRNEFKSFIDSLPEAPGIYKFYDVDEQIIYIGKAKNLKKRVRSYFFKKQDNIKVKILVRKIANIDFIIVDSESDALLLENSLIKKYKPRYNILLKDDKTYPWIVVKNENFPRILVTRSFINDGSSYFGPYSSVRLLRTVLDLIKHLYKLRTCNLNLSEINISKGKFKACLEFHLGNCLAPCEGKTEMIDYHENISIIKNILKGNISTVLHYLRELMLINSNELDFENANLLKKKIELIESYQSRSLVVNAEMGDVDIFALVVDGKYAFVNYFKVVNGSIIRSHAFELVRKMDESKSYMLMLAISEILVKVYPEGQILPVVILPFKINFELPYKKIYVPKKGDKFKLLRLCEKNLKFYQQDKMKHKEIAVDKKDNVRLLQQLKKDLNLKEIPYWIECFDNSNIQGTFPVASCVVFKNGRPSKKDYRHFNIKTVSGIDDFASMSEIVKRRYQRLLSENSNLPQLIVVDGGKGQLKSAIESLSELNILDKVEIISIAKRLEEIYKPGDSIPLYLDKKSSSLKTIQYLRDEAHRFGITFHRKKRSKDFINSNLLNIKGIGEKTSILLLKKFKTVLNIENSTLDELIECIGKSKADTIYSYFHQNN